MRGVLISQQQRSTFDPLFYALDDQTCKARILRKRLGYNLT